MAGGSAREKDDCVWRKDVKDLQRFLVGIFINFFCFFLFGLIGNSLTSGLTSFDEFSECVRKKESNKESSLLRQVLFRGISPCVDCRSNYPVIIPSYPWATSLPLTRRMMRDFMVPVEDGSPQKRQLLEGDMRWGSRSANDDVSGRNFVIKREPGTRDSGCSNPASNATVYSYWHSATAEVSKVTCERNWRSAETVPLPTDHCQPFGPSGLLAEQTKMNLAGNLRGSESETMHQQTTLASCRQNDCAASASFKDKIFSSRSYNFGVKENIPHDEASNSSFSSGKIENLRFNNRSH
ncbi:hypothetical protein CAPTEDRAFT_192215 [Capitella teleta]|uniref:Uncharacterized protein n=1 Tax=Capitella teleta TaxID=283909 RepID=R7TPH2_CAPTE|nr:hypothetical protein CAPTEDRAFT_192215 [Capitella teleta]|eukprot:ELT95783.1 hypothetical protein CAPTEDRAFT_192215 [Capitella teleta]